MTKVRISKKFVAIATTIMMLAAMILPVAAAPGNPEGSITVHKFAGNVPSVQDNNTGEVQSVPAGYVPLGGAEFTLYTVNAATIATLNAAITEDNKVVGHTIDTSGATPVVTFDLFNSDTGVASTVVAATVVYEVQTTETDETSPNHGQAVFGNNDIPDGFYVLAETVTPSGYNTVAPSLIRLPLTKLDGTFNYDVHVYPKNVSNQDLAVKDFGTANPTPITTDAVIPFELKAKFQNAVPTDSPIKINSVADLRAGAGTVADPYTYGVASITEHFDTYFRLHTDINVYWLDTAGEIDTVSGSLPTTHYTITPTVGTLPGPAGETYTVTLTAAGIDAAVAGNKVGFGLGFDAQYVGAPIAGVEAPTVLKNTMTAGMYPPGVTPDPGTPGDPDDPGDGGTTEDTTHIPSISIEINKFQEDGVTRLDDVTFALATVELPRINYVPGTPASALSAAELAILEEDYVVDATGVPITATTTSTGYISFAHLNGYSDITGATFYLKELQTKAGYQLKVNTIEVSFLNKADYIAASALPANTHMVPWFEAGEWTANAQITEGADINNYPLGQPDPDEPGFNLPLTGGAGTLAFTAIGIVVMLGAAILYLNGKKKNI